MSRYRIHDARFAYDEDQAPRRWGVWSEDRRKVVAWCTDMADAELIAIALNAPSARLDGEEGLAAKLNKEATDG